MDRNPILDKGPLRTTLGLIATFTIFLGIVTLVCWVLVILLGLEIPIVIYPIIGGFIGLGMIPVMLHLTGGP